MDRRATLAALFGAKRSRANTTTTPSLGLTSGLEPYAGPWGYDEAAHLLRRSMFGPSRTQIEQAISQGLYPTLALLFADTPVPAPPVNPNNATDPNVPIGETWIDAPYSTTVNLTPTAPKA
ncbi:MAG: hypothetical protein IPN33_11930 [Saprospiraceae bacterium]|nr:hypothetical protein [Saprospiraceae bacterium]